jgi:hypothetical protein
MELANATNINRKSGEAEGPAVSAGGEMEPEVIHTGPLFRYVRQFRCTRR